MSITTERLVLRSWRDSDADDFARMNADAEVMADLGGPLSRAASDGRLRAYAGTFDAHGITRWVVTDQAGRFLGYCGTIPQPVEHALGRHHDVGWRLIRSAWGRGYATEAATAALTDVFTRAGVTEVFACTAPDNTRSQAVMERLGLERRPELDFTRHFEAVGQWTGLVWVATTKTSVVGHARRGHVATRSATPRDADVVEDYHARCFERTYATQLAAGELRPPDRAGMRAQFRSWFETDSDVETQIVERDGTPIAHCSVSGNRLVHLFVDPAHQRSGIGGQLLAMAEATMAQGGHDEYELHVRVENAAAIAFYLRAGWAMTDQVIRAAEHGIVYDEHVLVKRLR
ncbi:MAG: GNAT family N-acetyltransferase [Actinomycetota bacterium]